MDSWFRGGGPVPTGLAVPVPELVGQDRGEEGWFGGR
jgi:hypothetical protein